MAPDNLQSQTELEIQFKKRARRRLVGAVALVLLMIVILPMLLQDKVDQASNEVVISIPGQDQPLETKLNSEPVKVPETVQPSDSPAPESSMPVAESDIVSNPAPSTPSPAASSSAATAAAPTLTPSLSTQSATQPVATASPALETKPQTTTSASLPLDKAKPDAASTSPSFIIQIGVFSDPDKVRQLQIKLSGKGLKSRTDLVDTPKGKKTRLRVGAFSSKNEAEVALLKVKTLGLTDAVIGNE
jgi:DedD protein